MRAKLFPIFIAGLVLGSSLSLGMGGKKDTLSPRILEFVYSAEFPSVAKDSDPIDIFIPLAQTDDYQTILERKITTDFPGKTHREKKYGNEYWHSKVSDSKGKPITVTVKYKFVRKPFHKKNIAKEASAIYPRSTVRKYAKFLKANKRTPIKGKFIDEIAADVPKSDGTPAGKARAIYDFVVDTMEYKKVGTGWGNGDTFWACSNKYGNCTDFHALFISLARREKIPSRFEIGFPIPMDRDEGKIGGYHCWVNFYLPQSGWIPIDASEAKKHPEKRELYYGTHPPDRIKFTVGRDLKLGKEHKSPPLNYFVYPHAEQSGKAFSKKEIKTEFSYKEVSA